MSTLLQSIKGMNDILPTEAAYWQRLEDGIESVLAAYDYREIRLPIVEKTELFKRSIGEVTDIVEKEMYTFDDRNGDSLTLRPEGTASCVRAALENGLLHNQTQRLWYKGPMFRHERPQKGRYRQFHQVGVEAFGFPGPDIDAELILLTARLWRVLKLNSVSLQVNSLGSSEDRKRYREVLVDYFKGHEQTLDSDSQRRLSSNPLRILDSKNPALFALIENAPSLQDYLGEPAKQHFAALLAILDANGVRYQVNPRLVRGLDYYCYTVFEWVADATRAQGTICAGGRYDGLVEQLGGKPCVAAGFALGLERLLDLVREDLEAPAATDIYLVVAGDQAIVAAQQLAEQLRDHFPSLRILCHCGGGGLKSQFKRADKSGAKIALILGEQELAAAEIGVKYLRDQTEQVTIRQAALLDTVTAVFSRKSIKV